MDDLEVYRLSHRIAVEIHDLTLRLPKFEIYEIGSQLRRASKSISANIVEGYGRRSYKAEFIKFLIYAHSSCDESREWLIYIIDCHPALAEEAEQVKIKIQGLGRKINRFIRGVESSHRSQK